MTSKLQPIIAEDLVERHATSLPEAMEGALRTAMFYSTVFRSFRVAPPSLPSDELVIRPGSLPCRMSFSLGVCNLF